MPVSVSPITVQLHCRGPTGNDFLTIFIDAQACFSPAIVTGERADVKLSVKKGSDPVSLLK
jgi:hypothetical protein